MIPVPGTFLLLEIEGVTPGNAKVSGVSAVALAERVPQDPHRGHLNAPG